MRVLIAVCVTLAASCCLAQPREDIRNALLGGTTSIIASGREGAWTFLKQQPLSDIKAVVEDLLTTPEKGPWYAPVFNIMSSVVDAFGADIIPSIQEPLLHTHSAFLLKEMRYYSPQKGWELKLYETLASQADDPAMRSRAGASFTSAAANYPEHWTGFQPETAVGYCCRGFARLNLARQHREAGPNAYAAIMADFDQALTLQSRYPRALVGKARVLRAREQHQEALALLDQAIREDPTLVEAYDLRAYINRQLGNQDRYQADLEIIRRLNRDERERYLRSAEGFEETCGRASMNAFVLVVKPSPGLEQQVLPLYDQLIPLQGDVHPDLYLTRAMLRRFLGRNADACADLDAYLQRHPEGAYGYCLRAQLRRLAGDVAGAASDDERHRALVAHRPVPELRVPEIVGLAPTTTLTYHKIREMAQHPDPVDVAALAEAAAASNADGPTRDQALMALKAYDAAALTPALPHLRRMLLSPPTTGTVASYAVTELLTKLQDPTAPMVLVRDILLQGAPVGTPTDRCLETLAQFPDACALPALEYFLLRAEHEQVRRWVLLAIGKRTGREEWDLIWDRIQHGTREEQFAVSTGCHWRAEPLLTLLDIATDTETPAQLRGRAASFIREHQKELVPRLAQGE